MSAVISSRDLARAFLDEAEYNLERACRNYLVAGDRAASQEASDIRDRVQELRKAATPDPQSKERP